MCCGPSQRCYEIIEGLALSTKLPCVPWTAYSNFIAAKVLESILPKSPRYIRKGATRPGPSATIVTQTHVPDCVFCACICSNSYGVADQEVYLQYGYDCSIENGVANQPIPLRHLYLNATGINERACKAISSYLALPSCALTSLYMSNNPIGSAATSLAPGLSSNQTLERISLQSCGLSDASTAALLSALEHHPNLKALDIGQSFATEDLGMRYNWLADPSAFVRFVQNAPALQYLNVAHMPMTQEAINTVLEAVATSPSMLSLENTARPLFRGDRSAVRAGQEGVRLAKQVRERLHANVYREYGVDYEQFHSGEKRFLMSPRDVRFIDSVYRNRDAGKARRGLMRLDKVWAEGDGTLEMVAQT